MHIPEKFVQRWFKKFKEGGVYRICRFQVVYNTYRNKTTTHRYMLNFSEKTTVGVLKDVDLPRYIYDREDYNFFKEECDSKNEESVNTSKVWNSYPKIEIVIIL